MSHPFVLSRLAKTLESRALTLVLPEATDERVLAAARVLLDRRLARSVLIGATSEINAAADAADIALDGLTILDPKEHRDQDFYVRQYLQLRPGSSPGIARRLTRKPLFLGGSVLRANRADAMLAGVSHPTARVIEACLMTVGLADGIETPSSCFLMIMTGPDGDEQCLIFADCAVNIDPDANELADIAVASAMTCRELLGENPRVALLSFSTKGSANHALARDVAEAASLAASRAPDIAFDGELQADAALVSRVANTKLGEPGPVAGCANVLVFPDLGAGNIAYKLTQYLAGAKALGPLLQGFERPVSDLSRGASVDDIVETAIVTLARAGTK